VDSGPRAADWIGRRVPVVVDRPLGTPHPEDGRLVYALNYGFVPGTRASDGDPIDVYIIDVDRPLAECRAEVIAVIRRRDDAEYKLVARVGRGEWSPSEILARTHFQERFFDSYVEGAEGPLD
jgi:inorganic pyrophosphatase